MARLLLLIQIHWLEQRRRCSCFQTVRLRTIVYRRFPTATCQLLTIGVFMDYRFILLVFNPSPRAYGPLLWCRDLYTSRETRYLDLPFLLPSLVNYGKSPFKTARSLKETPFEVEKMLSKVEDEAGVLIALVHYLSVNSCSYLEHVLGLPVPGKTGKDSDQGGEEFFFEKS